MGVAAISALVAFLVDILRSRKANRVGCEGTNEILDLDKDGEECYNANREGPTYWRAVKQRLFCLRSSEEAVSDDSIDFCRNLYNREREKCSGNEADIDRFLRKVIGNSLETKYLYDCQKPSLSIRYNYAYLVLTYF